MKAVCGLDVHKDSIYLCILHPDGELFEQVFGVLTFQLHEMCKLLKKHHVSEVSMESTSIYWVPIWRVLSPHFTLRLVNPYFIKQLPGHKSDVKDAQWIAECTKKELVMVVLYLQRLFSNFANMTVESLTSMRKLCVRNPKWMLYSNGATSA